MKIVSPGVTQFFNKEIVSTSLTQLYLKTYTWLQGIPPLHGPDDCNICLEKIGQNVQYFHRFVWYNGFA